MGILCKNCRPCGQCRGTGTRYIKNRGNRWCIECGGHGKKFCSKHEKERRSGKPCFLTTAIVDHLGKGDGCHELEALRDFRDSYMSESSERIRMVTEYYRISPGLVDVINRMSSADGKFPLFLYDAYIAPSVKFVEDGRNDEALLTYKSLVDFLISRQEQS